jgi:hypothetical protein
MQFEVGVLEMSTTSIISSVNCAVAVSCSAQHIKLRVPLVRLGRRCVNMDASERKALLEFLEYDRSLWGTNHVAYSKRQNGFSHTFISLSNQDGK